MSGLVLNENLLTSKDGFWRFSYGFEFSREQISGLVLNENLLTAKDGFWRFFYGS